MRKCFPTHSMRPALFYGNQTDIMKEKKKTTDNSPDEQM